MAFESGSLHWIVGIVGVTPTRYTYDLKYKYIYSNGGRDNDIPNIILTANVVIKDEKLVKFKLNDAYNAEDESEAIKLSRVHLKEIENIFKKAKTREFFG